MRKCTIQTNDNVVYVAWLQMLDAAGKPYETAKAMGKMQIKLDEDDATGILGLTAFKTMFGQRLYDHEEATRPAMSKNKKRMLGCAWAFIGLVALIFAIGMASAFFSKPKPVEEMTVQQQKEHYKKVFGPTSAWFHKELRPFVVHNYVTYPRTFKVEGFTVISIMNNDSLLVRLDFSAENAFKQRSDHSVTAVIGVDSTLQRVRPSR
jgi:hypothetical protein